MFSPLQDYDLFGLAAAHDECISLFVADRVDNVARFSQAILQGFHCLTRFLRSAFCFGHKKLPFSGSAGNCIRGLKAHHQVFTVCSITRISSAEQAAEELLSALLFEFMVRAVLRPTSPRR